MRVLIANCRLGKICSFFYWTSFSLQFFIHCTRWQRAEHGDLEKINIWWFFSSLGGRGLPRPWEDKPEPLFPSRDWQGCGSHCWKLSPTPRGHTGLSIWGMTKMEIYMWGKFHRHIFHSKGDACMKQTLVGNPLLNSLLLISFDSYFKENFISCKQI